jgi:intergrase/recombinase
MKKENFTADRISKFKCAPDKEQSIFWDGKTPGLGLRVTANGAKSYVFETNLNGKTLRMTIGSSKTWTLDAAQKAACDLKATTDKGLDPRQIRAAELAESQAKQAAKEAEIIAQKAYEAQEKEKRELIARTAWDAYIVAPHPKKWGEQHRNDHIIAALNGGQPCKIGNTKSKPAPLAFLLNMPLHEINAPVVQQWLADECKTRPTFAHNCFRKFRTFVRWCAKHPEYKHIVHEDCCVTDDVKAVIPKTKSKPGDCLQREQLQDWFAAVNKISNPVISAYLKTLLITGARRSEVEVMKWDDIDFKWNSIIIRDKVEGLRTIPLTPYLSRLLAALPRRNQWVFSSPTAESGHIKEPRIAHTQALQIAGLPHVSIHGLRRSFGTLAEWIEMPSGIVAQIQGHKPSALVEKHYRRRPLDLLRMWHTRIEAWILEQAGIESVSDLGQLPPGKRDTLARPNGRDEGKAALENGHQRASIIL